MDGSTCGAGHGRTADADGVAATLSLVEPAGSAGAPAEHLAAETGTAAPALRRLFDHLVTIGVFERNRDRGLYRPTSLGDQLSADAPHGLKLLLEINSACTRWSGR